VLLVVGADPRDVETTARALDHRFAPDYRVVTAGSAAAALTALEREARRGEQVALVAADLRPPDSDGVEFSSEPRACTAASPAGSPRPRASPGRVRDRRGERWLARN
jgi:CheY-like chemotaxis protein